VCWTVFPKTYLSRYPERMPRQKLKRADLEKITDFTGLEKPKKATGHEKKRTAQVHKNKRTYERKKKIEEPLE
jgi:hypothetical protein